MARPAEPILASSLISHEQLDDIFSRVIGGKTAAQADASSEKSTKDERLKTGVKSLDRMLRGGIKRGEVVGIWGEGGAWALTLPLLTHSLLHHPREVAVIIDTTGNFDVLRIYSAIVSSLKSDLVLLRSLGGEEAEREGQSEDVAVENIAAKVLDRLKIMRVFDMVGVMEAVGEIGSETGGRREGGMAMEMGEKEDGGRDDMEEGGEVEGDDEAVLEQQKTGREKEAEERKERVIPDSEDEEDEEMLFELPEQSAARTRSTSVLSTADPDHIQPLPTVPEVHPKVSHTEEKISFILIDNLAHVLTPLIKKDYVQAHALTTPLLHTLSHLTHTHSLTTILLNPLSIPPPAPTSTSRPPIPNSADPNAHKPTWNTNPKPAPPPSPSIFMDNKAVPSLMGVVGRYVDLGVMVWGVGKGSGIRGEKGKGKVSGVVEIISDRYGDRVEDWGTYSLDSEGGIRDVVAG